MTHAQHRLQAVLYSLWLVEEAREIPLTEFNQAIAARARAVTWFDRTLEEASK